jgi:hypothetical protein
MNFSIFFVLCRIEKRFSNFRNRSQQYQDFYREIYSNSRDAELDPNLKLLDPNLKLENWRLAEPNKNTSSFFSSPSYHHPSWLHCAGNSLNIARISTRHATRQRRI